MSGENKLGVHVSEVFIMHESVIKLLQFNDLNMSFVDSNKGEIKGRAKQSWIAI